MQTQNKESCTYKKTSHRNEVMHTMHTTMHLCLVEFHFDKWQRKKNIATVRLALKYDPKRPQVDRNSDKPLPKYCW